MRLVVKYLGPIILLLSGILILAMSSLLPAFIPQWAFLLGMFSIANFSIAKYFGLAHRLRSVWRFGKLSHFPIGVTIGTAPAVGVLALTGIGLDLRWSDITLTANGVAATLAIVTWEELWFRGVALEYAALKYTKIGAALIFAMLFTVLHIFNPAIDFAVSAPDLLLGGYALAMAYFAFNSIYAPIGMHFGSNLLEGSLQQLEYSPLRSQPYIYLAVTALISIGLTIIFFKRRTL